MSITSPYGFFSQNMMSFFVRPGKDVVSLTLVIHSPGRPSRNSAYASSSPYSNPLASALSGSSGYATRPKIIASLLGSYVTFWA